MSEAGPDTGELPVTGQEDNTALLLRAGTRGADAARGSGGSAVGVQRALWPARLRPLCPPGAGQGLQAAGEHHFGCCRGAHVRADPGAEAGQWGVAQPAGLLLHGKLLCHDEIQARAQTQPGLPACQEETVLVLGWHRGGGVLNGTQPSLPSPVLYFLRSFNERRNFNLLQMKLQFCWGWF